MAEVHGNRTPPGTVLAPHTGFEARIFGHTGISMEIEGFNYFK